MRAYPIVDKATPSTQSTLSGGSYFNTRFLFLILVSMEKALGLLL